MRLSEYDLDRLEALKRARRRATALLVTVAAVFVFTFFLGDSTWVGFLRTGMEAAMIGGLADWFAVTALFRHPLGIPIPHTAIIPRSKEGLARSLGEFVRHNFLSPDQLAERLEESRLPHRLGVWLTDEDHAHLLAGHLAGAVGNLGKGPDPEVNRSEDQGWLGSLPVGKWLGRSAERALAEGRHRQLMSAAIGGLASLLEDNRHVLRRRIGDESPWWVPATVDDAVFERAHDALHRFLLEVAVDPEHELRRAIDTRLVEAAQGLQVHPEWNRKVNEQLAELVTDAAGDLRSALDQPDGPAPPSGSDLEKRLTEALHRLGQRLTGDADLQERLEGGLRALAGPLSRIGQRELGDLIAVTVERWDAADTSRRLELWMGRDLQFVRINGTVVGGLAGLAIHTAVFLLAG